MGLRTDALLYAQIVGVFFFLQYYESDVIFTGGDAVGDSIISLQDLLRHVFEAKGYVLNYFYGAYVFLGLVGVVRAFAKPSLPDFFYLFTLAFNGFWYLAYLQPAINQFIGLDGNAALTFFPQFLYYQNVFLFSVFLLLIESLLASFIYYIMDPIENLLMNIMIGVLSVDLTYDIPFVLDPIKGGANHFLHITHGIGSTFLEIQVPVLVVTLGLIIIYRTVIQRSLTNFFILLLFIAGGAGLHLVLIPIETALSKTKFGAATVASQKNVAYAHFAFFLLLVAISLFKWITSWRSYHKKHSSTHSSSALPASAAKGKLDHDKKQK